MTDIFTKEKRQGLMSKVKNKNTDIELILRKELWRLGYRFRVGSKLFGKPDIVFRKKRLVIFCDGNFWHGKSYSKEKVKYKKFWRDKIATNIKRDKEVTRKLKKDGWIVFRFWKSEILSDPNQCVSEIVKYLSSERRPSAVRRYTERVGGFRPPRREKGRKK